ncbi:MAG: flap structure-specific endonuclease, partial [Nanoarchaeota archaeon]
QAKTMYNQAVLSKETLLMKKYASRTTYLTQEMITDAKSLLDVLGIPWIQAPSEGEAQSAHLVKKGVTWASVSQDFDSLLYGCDRLIQNLSATGRRKRTAKLGTIPIQPKLIDLNQNLKVMGITTDQLIAVAILIGTDYNKGGVKGIGPKTALRLVKMHGEHFDELFKDVDFDKHSHHHWKEIFDTFKTMPVTDDYNIIWKKPSFNRLRSFLIDEHGFSLDRVEKTIKELEASVAFHNQKSIFDFR